MKGTFAMLIKFVYSWDELRSEDLVARDKYLMLDCSCGNCWSTIELSKICMAMHVGIIANIKVVVKNSKIDGVVKKMDLEQQQE